MAETLQNQIKEWANTGPYWFTSLCYKLLMGEAIDDNLFDDTYDLFLEDCNLVPKTKQRPEINFPVEVDAETVVPAADFKLKNIKNIEHVNALAAGQSIAIHPNLTIIYGANGAGKSGYVRLLNKAFNSRGDKSILRNVLTDDPQGIPTCIFTFQNNQGEYDIDYATSPNSNEFSKFSVFDTHSINAHLEGNNRLNFVPIGFEFFEHLMISYEAIKSRFENNISDAKPTNIYLAHFVNDNAVRNFIASLGPSSDIELLNALAVFGEPETEELQRLSAKMAELNALNVAEKVTEMNLKNQQLTAFKDNARKYLVELNDQVFPKYKKLIDDLEGYIALANLEGIAALKEYEIPNLGSEQWMKFITAAKKLAHDFDLDEEYPQQDDSCLFCLQPLTSTQINLIESYWNVLQSQAQQNVTNCNNLIAESIATLTALPEIKFDKETTLYQFIESINPELAVKWNAIISGQAKTRADLITNLKNKDWTLNPVGHAHDLNQLNVIKEFIDLTLKGLSEIDPAQEIITLTKQYVLLNDRFLLSKMKDAILEHIDNHKWAQNATIYLSRLSPRSITMKQGALFKEHITEKYTEKFNKESKILKAPGTVSINQTNQAGNTLRSLQIVGHKANLVLSEGEQRAVSLADFLTEAQLNENKTGVFFDDPVTSLDHERRHLIAERIVELASTIQVVIFTHDIPFFIKLQLAAESAGLEFSTTAMRREGGNPGIIKDNHPWVTQKVKDRIGFLKNEINILKRLERDDPEERYEYEAKRFYGLLREGWERAVEERLFKGVVERFNLGIQTQKLDRVVVTPELIADIGKGMTDCSSWVHDSAAGLNPTIPDFDRAQADLDFFEEFHKKCPAA